MKRAQNRQSLKRRNGIFDLISRYILHLENYTIETCCKMCHGHPVAHPQFNAFTNDCVSRYGNAGSHARTHAHMHACTHGIVDICIQNMRTKILFSIMRINRSIDARLSTRGFCAKNKGKIYIDIHIIRFFESDRVDKSSRYDPEIIIIIHVATR